MPVRTPARLLASVACLAVVAAGGTARAQSNQGGTAAAVDPDSTRLYLAPHRGGMLACVLPVPEGGSS